MSDGRSWFRLTLWHGTPPEFTEQVDVDIAESDSVLSSIQSACAVETKIEKTNSFLSKIGNRESFNVDIIKGAEVVWYVG